MPIGQMKSQSPGKGNWKNRGQMPFEGEYKQKTIKTFNKKEPENAFIHEGEVCLEKNLLARYRKMMLQTASRVADLSETLCSKRRTKRAKSKTN